MALGMDEDLIPMMGLEIPSCANVIFNQDGLGFVLNEFNLKLHNGIRSEISVNYPYSEGDTVEYIWLAMFPSSAPPGGRSDQWWSIAQWHDQPDLRIGETWANFKVNSPPLAIFVENRNGALGIGLNGLKGRRVNWRPVPLDVWLEMRVTVRWSTKDDGYARLRVLGSDELDMITLGRNMLNSYQHYFKLGQYRAPTVKNLSVVYYKDLKFKNLSKKTKTQALTQ